SMLSLTTYLPPLHQSPLDAVCGTRSTSGRRTSTVSTTERHASYASPRTRTAWSSSTPPQQQLQAASANPRTTSRAATRTLITQRPIASQAIPQQRGEGGDVKSYSDMIHKIVTTLFRALTAKNAHLPDFHSRHPTRLFQRKT